MLTFLCAVCGKRRVVVLCRTRVKLRYLSSMRTLVGLKDQVIVNSRLAKRPEARIEYEEAIPRAPFLQEY